MELMEHYDQFEEERIYRKAKKKAQNIRGFYINLMLYCLIIPILVFVNLKYTPEYQWFWFSMLGWGIGLSFHAMETFDVNSFLGKDWEERKIKEILEKEKNKQNTPDNGKI